MGDKWETSVKSCSKTPRVGDKCGRQAENKCKLMRPKAPKCDGQGGDKCKIMQPKAPRVGDQCGRQVGDKCKLMRPKAPRVRDKCGRQGGDKYKTQKWTAAETIKRNAGIFHLGLLSEHRSYEEIGNVSSCAGTVSHHPPVDSQEMTDLYVSYCTLSFVWQLIL